MIKFKKYAGLTLIELLITFGLPGVVITALALVINSSFNGVSFLSGRGQVAGKISSALEEMAGVIAFANDFPASYADQIPDSQMPLIASSSYPPGGQNIKTAIYDFGASYATTSYAITYSCTTAPPDPPGLWNLYISADGINWGSAVAGELCTTDGTKTAAISETGRFAKYEAIAATGLPGPSRTMTIILSAPQVNSGPTPLIVSQKNYTASPTTVIISLPSVDSQGGVVEGKFDTIIFDYISGTQTLTEYIFPDIASTRQKVARDLANNLASVNFSTNLTSKKYVTISLTGKQMVSGRQVDFPLTQTVYIMNQ